MKKTFLTIMLLLSTLMLVACGNVTTEIQTEAPTVAPTEAPTEATTEAPKNMVYVYDQASSKVILVEEKDASSYIEIGTISIADINKMTQSDTKVYILEAYATEIKDSAKGEGYLYDFETGDTIIFYGLSVLGTGFTFTVTDGAITGVAYDTSNDGNPANFASTGVTDGALVKLLVYPTYYEYKNIMEVNAEVLEVSTTTLATKEVSCTPTITSNDNLSSFSVDKESYLYGDTVKVTIEAKEGYNLSSV